MLLDAAAKRADFRALHKEGYFLLPTAWDVGGAKRLEALGFAGFASSNASLAWSLGCDINQVTLEQTITHLNQLVGATELAVNADFGSGFATCGRDLSENVRRAIDTGIAALSIEDRGDKELYDPRQAAARVEICRNAIERSGANVLLVARAGESLSGRTRLADTIERLVAYSRAGADVLCAPSITKPTVIKAVVEALAPKSLDVQLMKSGMGTAELAQLGVRRVSVGNAFAQASWSSFERIAQHFIDFGDLPQECFPSA